jgi:hypothetical protein
MTKHKKLHRSTFERWKGSKRMEDWYCITKLKETVVTTNAGPTSSCFSAKPRQEKTVIVLDAAQHLQSHSLPPNFFPAEIGEMEKSEPEV